MEKIKKYLQECIENGKLLHLSGFQNGVPWMCHVWYAPSDTFGKIYFTSNKSRNHSQFININPIVSGGIVPINLEGLGQKVIGMSFTGQAKEADSNTLSEAYSSYSKRWPQVEKMFTLNDIITELSPMRMYIVEMQRITLFDEVNFPDNPRQEISL